MPDPWKFNWDDYVFVGNYFFWKHFTPVTYNIWTDEEAQIYSLVWGCYEKRNYFAGFC